MELQQLNSTTKKINFSCDNIDAWHVSTGDTYLIKEESIVINLGLNPAIIEAYPIKTILPRKSVLVKNVMIHSSESLLIITVANTVNIGGVILNKEWLAAEQIFGNDLAGVPLWRSPQIEIGETEFNPIGITGGKAPIENIPVMRFKIKINLWYAPADTHCVIHNKHDFIEYHTQITGIGRMQKFRENNFSSMYEEIRIAEGNTHDLFCETSSDLKFIYPWHQYYADTDCIWMATELHPVSIIN